MAMTCISEPLSKAAVVSLTKGMSMSMKHTKGTPRITASVTPRLRLRQQPSR